MTASESKDDLKKCPYCAEKIKAKATLCKFCKSELSTDAMPASSPLPESQPTGAAKTHTSSHIQPPDGSQPRAFVTSKPSTQKALSPVLIAVGMAALLGIGAGVYFLANNKSKPQVAANNNVVAPAANDQPGADQTQAVSDAGASQDSAAIINKILEAEKKGDDGTVDASVRQLQAHPPITTGDTEEAERLNKLGLAALKNAKYEDASTLFKSAAQANPADAKYFSNLAYAELNGGDFISAEEQVYKSIAIAPTRSVAWDDLGLVLAKKQDPDRAVAALLIGYRFSNEKTPIYFESLQKDPDTDVQAAATAALAKVQPSGQATDPILDPSLAPDGVVKELYRVHTDLNALFSTDEEKSKRNIPKYFDDQLCQQLLKASASGQIDADILWDTNGDPKLTNFTVSKGQLDQNGATVLVSFLSNGQEDHKTFDLRQTSNGWRIYDVIDKDGTHWIKLFGR